MRFSRNRVTAAVVLALFRVAAMGESIPTGPDAGQAVPDFQLRDQHGAARSLHSILGPKGALLVFYRSADW